MAINLTKGESVSLTEEAPTLRAAMIGLGWDINPETGNLANFASSSDDFDLDASAFILGANGRLLGEKNFLYYNNKETLGGGLRHSGDNRTGEGAGDDETIQVNFDRLPSEAQQVSFWVTIYEATKRNQSFRQLNNGFVRLCDASTGIELLRYDLDTRFAEETALEFCRLVKKDGGWTFQAVGEAHALDLGGALKRYN